MSASVPRRGLSSIGRSADCTRRRRALTFGCGPPRLVVTKVTIKSGKYTNILMGKVQAAIAHGVLDAVRSGDIPRDEVDHLGIIDSVWLDP